LGSLQFPPIYIYYVLVGRVDKDKHTLIGKHHDTRHNMDRLSVGGGVSLWPEMEDMRLSPVEILKLGAVCFLMFVLIITLFNKLHGEYTVVEI
jgi:hypothetical protein